MLKKGLNHIVTCLMLMTAAYGCAPAMAPPETPIPYPPPPDEPKIIYLQSYRGMSDFRVNSWLDTIFGAAPEAVLRQPYGVVAHDDKIFVTTVMGSVTVIDTRERKVGYIGDTGIDALKLPLGVAVAGENTLFVSDTKLKRIYAFDTQGKLKKKIGEKGEMQNPVGIGVNNKLGRLYVADSHAHMVHVYSINGEPLFKFGSRGMGDGEFNYPANIAVNQKTGNVYVVDSVNFRVEVFDQEGKYLFQFGEVGDVPGTFSRPRGIGIDSDDNVYVVDAAFGNFQVFNEKGELLLFVGGPGTGPGEFDLPAGISVDEQDRIFVVDGLNGRVEMFQYLSEKWKKGHPGEYEKYVSPRPVTETKAGEGKQ